MADLDALEILGTCSVLYSLDLRGNPLSTIEHYRQIVHYHLPLLKVLDGTHVSRCEG